MSTSSTFSLSTATDAEFRLVVSDLVEVQGMSWVLHELANLQGEQTKVIDDMVEDQPLTKAQVKVQRKLKKQERATEYAAQILDKHEFQVDPLQYTLKALKEMLRTGEPQAPKKKKGPNAWMCFLQDVRSGEVQGNGTKGAALTKYAGQMWRDMSAEDKQYWTDKTQIAEEDAQVLETLEKIQEESKIQEAQESEAQEDTAQESKTQETGVQVVKMKKGELSLFLHETYGWTAKEMRKYTVKELRTAQDTGVLPEEQMEARRATKQAAKQAKKLVKQALTESNFA
jgi:hypothetical protein